MELILCCFKGLKPFKLIAVGDENSPREASETDVNWLADKACVLIGFSWAHGLSLKFIYTLAGAVLNTWEVERDF